MAAVTTAPRVVRAEFQDRTAGVSPAKGVAAALGVGVHLRTLQFLAGSFCRFGFEVA